MNECLAPRFGYGAKSRWQMALSFRKLRRFFLYLIRPLAPYLAFPIAWFICSSVRIRLVNGEIEQKLREQGGPVIYAFWHGRLLYLMHRYKGGYHPILVSESRDGDLIGSLSRLFGFRPVRGSSSSRGGRAFRELIRSLKRGKSCGISPDGPRGPRQRAQLGAVALASLTGAPIFPITCGAKRAVFAMSWDRFMIPAPFTEVVVVCGNPIEVGHRAEADELERKRLALERELNSITAAADEFFRASPSADLNKKEPSS